MSDSLPRIGQIEATDAADGDVPTFDAAAGRLVMAPPSGGGGGSASPTFSFFMGG